jgi:hypothetical protein
MLTRSLTTVVVFLFACGSVSAAGTVSVPVAECNPCSLVPINTLLDQIIAAGYGNVCCIDAALSPACQRTDSPFQITSEGTLTLASNSTVCHCCDNGCPENPPPCPAVTASLSVTVTKNELWEVSSKITGDILVLKAEAQLKVGEGGSLGCTSTATATVTPQPCKWVRLSMIQNFKNGRTAQCTHSWTFLNTIGNCRAELSGGVPCPAPYNGMVASSLCATGTTKYTANVCISTGTIGPAGHGDCMNGVPPAN